MIKTDLPPHRHLLFDRSSHKNEEAFSLSLLFDSFFLATTCECTFIVSGCYLMKRKRQFSVYYIPYIVVVVAHRGGMCLAEIYGLIFLIQNGRVTLLIAMAENKKSEILWLVQLICLYERIERPPC